MKRAYKKPQFEVVEYRFADHIMASGVDNCYWGGGETYTHRLAGCREQVKPGSGGYIDFGPS